MWTNKFNKKHTTYPTIHNTLSSIYFADYIMFSRIHGKYKEHNGMALLCKKLTFVVL